jgi:predicted aspartyl protease
MKRQIRIALGLAGFVAAASLYPCFAEAQIATPTVTAIPGAAHEVPFELFRDSRIFLEGRVNGNETPLILDSGAGVTTIDRDFAKTIGLKKGIPLTAQGVGGRAQGELVQNVTLEIGNLKLSGVSVAVLDLAPIEKAIGRPMPVILGHELFMNSIVALDFDNKLLTLSPAGNFLAPEGATEVRLKRQGTLHFLPIEVDGHAPIEAALDLGNGGALSLSKEYHESVPEIGKLHYAVGLSGGVGGLHETRRVSIPKVEIGGFTFDDVPTDLGSVGEGPYHGRANAGIELFKPFTMTLDLGHDRLWLKRTAKPAVFTKDRAGMFVMLEDDHFNVLHVTPGSPAEQAGIKKGDRLTVIGGERVGAGFYTSKEANWSRRPAGTRVALTKSDGQSVTLTLADYY